jgi:hypothetical protein
MFFMGENNAKIANIKTTGGLPMVSNCTIRGFTCMVLIVNATCSLDSVPAFVAYSVLREQFGGMD